MKKSILKLLLIIIITSLILFLFAGCKSPGITELEERIEKLELEERVKALEEELAKKEAEEASSEEEEESPEIITDDDGVVEDPIEEEEADDGADVNEDTDAEADADTNTDADDADKEAPTISLAIYEGPTLDGSICYYRVEATVTGNPNSTVNFSKDDSGGAWGSKKVQINLNNPGDTYNLTATATNSEGSATDFIALSWGCAIPPIVKSVDIGADASLSGEIIVNFFVEQGKDPVYVGDSVFNNKSVRAYLSFDIDDLGDIDDINIKDVSVTLPIDLIVGHPEMVVGSEVEARVVYYGDSLELIDQNLGSYKAATIAATNPLTEFIFSSSTLVNQLQEAVDVDKKWFQLKIETSGVLANGIWDYYRIPIGGVELHITYEMPG